MKGWIFDLDGTLTLAAHDFDGFKRQAGLPEDESILEAMEALSPVRHAEVTAMLEQWEIDIAHRTVAAPDALPLLEAIRRAGQPMGIVTRNTFSNALRTLEAAGLADFFTPDVVFGRDNAAPKPNPDALLQLLTRWELPAEHVVMIGDHAYDIEAGRNAGCQTAWLNRLAISGGGFAHRDVHALDELLDWIA